MQLDFYYRSPGFLLLAVDGAGERLGCVGLRDLGHIDRSRCGEIRRMFVRGAGRGLGLGRALADELVELASTGGFERLVLNTLPTMREAIALYESIGFERCEPYVEEPLDDTLYYHLSISNRLVTT